MQTSTPRNDNARGQAGVGMNQGTTAVHGNELPPALQVLAPRKQFICYRLAPSTRAPGKLDKLPASPHTGQVVSAQDSAHWVSAADAIAAAAAWGQGYGIGFVLTAADPMFCVDVDNCLQPDGQWSPLARQVCAMFPGAAVECSVSGKGLHVWGRYAGPTPAHGCKNVALGIELYTERRFIALGLPGAVGDAGTDHTAALHAAIARYFPPSESSSLAPLALSDGPVPEWRGPTDDADLIRRALMSRSAASAFGGRASFADLWNADADALGRSYPDGGGRPYDASSADSALASHLAFWTGHDGLRIERLMRQSKLARDKWDARPEYLSNTLSAVLAMGGDVCKDKATAHDGIALSLLQLGTQDAIAQIFAREKSGHLLYDHSRGKWLEWDGTRWHIETTDKASDFVRDLCRQHNYERRSAMGSAAFIGGVEKIARADRAFAVTGADFDVDNYLLNTPAGTIDLRTNTLRPHDPADRITKIAGASPLPEGGAEFLRFLSEITLGDVELQEFLQLSLGACLSGAVEDHWMAFWIGAGRNGKNTLGDLVADAMGDYAKKVPTSTLMSKAHEEHPTAVANLQGARLAVSSEINEGEHWNEARINEVTGDATLSARFMRGDLFEFRRTHKHLIYGNHRPQLRTVGDAIKSRLKIVPFKASFIGREDADLPSRLRVNIGFVLAWLIEGHGKWTAAGKRLPSCKAADAESAEYFAAQATVDMWIAERLQILDEDTRNVRTLPKASDLYRDYAVWKQSRGENPVSMTRWGESMRRFEKVQSAGVRYRRIELINPFSM